MSLPEIALTAEPDSAPQPPSAKAPRGDTWRVSRSGLATVIRLELRQRVRSTRWVLALVVWTLVIGGATALIWWAFVDSVGVMVDGTPAEQAAHEAAERARAGRSMFGVTAFLVLALGSLVAPALSATSINGDRANGVLATLQTTLLTPAELVLGKLVAAWTTSLALLVTALPFVLWAYSTGGTPAGRLLVTLAVLVLTLLVVCAVGLGWSAITARTTSSAVLTYLSVALLGLGLPLIFAITLPINTQEERVRVLGMTSASPAAEGAADGEETWSCAWTTETVTRSHTERTWWLLAPNPFVLVADAAPRPATGQDHSLDDPLSSIRQAVREARLGPADYEVWCEEDAEARKLAEQRRHQEEALSPVWPVGVALDLALGLGFVLVAVRRLRAPSRKLQRGVRVA